MIKTFLSTTKQLRYRWHHFTYTNFADISSVSELKNQYKNKPMLVIGNGPSLNQTPLDEFIDVGSIGMNKIDLLFDRVKWRPTLILCANGLVVQQHWRTLSKSEIPVFLSWECRWIVSRRYRKCFKYFLSLANTEFSRDICEYTGSAGTITYKALQFAYFMGADPVILFGVDHSFNFQGNPNEYAKRQGKDVNHFDPNYFKEGQYWGLPNLQLSELAYKQAKMAFEEDGRNIYDATINGKLNIFPKISVVEAKGYCGLSR